MAEDAAVTGNASSPRQSRAAKRFERMRRAEQDADMAAFVSSDFGPRILARMFDRWSAFASVYSSDALDMARRAGRQDVAHELMTWMKHIPNGMERVLAARAKAEADIAAHARVATTEPDDEEMQTDG